MGKKWNPGGGKKGAKVKILRGVWEKVTSDRDAHIKQETHYPRVGWEGGKPGLNKGKGGEKGEPLHRKTK